MRRAAPLVALVLMLVLAGCTQPGGAGHPRSATPTAAGEAPTSGTAAAAGTAADVYAATEGPGLSPVVAGDPALVYVPNTLSNTVDVIDPRTFKVVRVFPTASTPHHVTPSWDLRHLYVQNTVGNSLTVIDPRTGRPTGTIPVTDPYNLYFTPDGRTAIVVAERFHRLDFRDPHTWALKGSVAVPYASVDHLDFSADGRILVVSCEFSGWLARVDVASMRITGTLHVGGLPVDVKLSPEGRVMYVANQGRGGVSVVDPSTMRELAFIRTGAGAHGLYVSRDTRSLYVTNRLAGSISVIDFATRRVTATWRIGGSPDMGGVSTDGRVFWVSGRFNGVVYAVDTLSGRLLATINVGDGPHGLAVFPQPGRYSLGHTGVYR